MNSDRPPPIQYGRIDCMGSIEKAIEHTKVVLFRPFDLNKWLARGVSICLSVLGTGGGGGVSFPNFNTGGGGPGGPAPSSPEEFVEEVRTMIAENLTNIIIIGSIGLIVVLALTLLITWLGARGRLMFVRAVALDDAGIGVNWNEAGRLSSSLFWFSIVLAAIGWIVVLGAAALGVFLFLVAVDAGAESFLEFWPYIGWPILIFLIYLAIMIPIWLLLNDFVVPVMYHFNLTVMPAWGVVRGMIRGNVWPLTLFYIIRFVVSIVKGIAVMLAGCVTCCVGFLPVLSQALTAPVHVFDRAFSMYALESMSDDFKMIQPVAVEIDPFEGSGDRLGGY